jgi:hypothetical protein
VLFSSLPKARAALERQRELKEQAAAKKGKKFKGRINTFVEPPTPGASQLCIRSGIIRGGISSWWH